MRNDMINDLNHLLKYQHLDDNGLKGIIYLTLTKWEKRFDFLTPTHKNLELLDMFDRNIPEIKWINEYKKKEEFFLLNTLYDGIKNSQTAESILQYIIDRAIIICIDDENYKKYLDVLHVTKVMAGGRKQPTRHIKMTNPHKESNKSDQPQRIKGNFRNFLNDVIADEMPNYIQHFWFDADRLYSWLEIEFDINLDDLKVGTRAVRRAFKSNDSEIIKKMMRQGRKALKEMVANNVLTKRVDRFTIVRDSLGSQATLTTYPKIVAYVNKQNEEKFIKQYKFEIERHPIKKRNYLKFNIRIRLEYNDLMSMIYELI